MTPQEELELLRLQSESQARARRSAPTTASDPQQRAVINRLRARNPGWRSLPDAEVLSRGWGTLAPTERDRLFPEGVGLRQQRSQNLANDVRSIPNLDLGRIGSDVAATASRDWNSFSQDPAGSIGRAIAGLPAAIWDSTAGASGRAQDAQDAEMAALLNGDRPEAVNQARAANRENTRAFMGTASLALSPLATTPLRGAGLGVLATAPQALDGDGPLQERIPQAAVSSAEAGALGASLGMFGRRSAATNPQPARALSQEALDNLQTLDDAGLPVAWGVVNGTGDMSRTMAAAQAPLGFTARRQLQELPQVAQSRAEDMANRVGQAVDPEAAGALTQSAIERFNEPAPPGSPQVSALRQAAPTLNDVFRAPDADWGFRTKAAVLYDHVLTPVEQAPAQVRNTPALLNEFLGEVRTSHDPILRQLQERLATPGLTVRNLRTLREDVRLAQRENATGRDAAQLQRLEQSLTQDIYNSLPNDQARANLQRVDRYYGERAERMQRVLAPLQRAHPGSVYSTVRGWASSARSADTARLQALRDSMRADEWNSFAASVIQDMGRGDSTGASFSLERFLNNYEGQARGLTANGRRILFGARAADLDTLARGLRLWNRTNRSRNFSNTANHIEARQPMHELGMLAAGAVGAGTHVAPGALPLAITYVLARELGAYATSELMMNPRFVRFLASTANARGAAVPAGAAWLRRLAVLAAKDPSLVPAYNALTRAQAPSDRGQPSPELQLQ